MIGKHAINPHVSVSLYVDCCVDTKRKWGTYVLIDNISNPRNVNCFGSHVYMQTKWQ
ncbi:hypothetical protein HanIR_Chr10g0456161 [Helianthus annuus]|nr:hypothetical protein HanIR_Chr10g0456161 [Helianthus annuus]